ncbi:MAG: hypothetical protein HC913_21120 [Microscillaceae bacterium]|nr:hypothetical protein [Microscillaceae bacterium]
MKTTILSFFFVFNVLSVCSQIVWVKPEQLPQHLIEVYGYDSLYHEISQGIVEVCNTNSWETYGFKTDMRIVAQNKSAPIDNYSIKIWLSDSLLRDDKVIKYRYQLSEKEHPLLYIESIFDYSNQSPSEMLDLICRYAEVIFHRSVSREVNTQAHNITAWQRDSLKLGDNFRNIIVEFDFIDINNPSDTQLIKNLIINQWHQTQANIWKYFGEKKPVYFNIYFVDKKSYSRKKNNDIINVHNPLKVTYHLSQKNQGRYLLNREVYGDGIGGTSTKKNIEINANDLKDYPIKTLSGSGGYLLVKDLLDLWGY